MPQVVRASKFRHVYGQATKKADSYDGIRITRSAVDTTFCAVNPKFLAVIVESGGGGAFIVLPIEKVGRVEREAPLVSGHRGAVLDIAWCPHDDNLIASGSEDCTVKIWQIPDGGIKENLQKPLVDLQGHQRRISYVLWHPSAKDVLMSAGSDMKIFIWNVGQSAVLSTINCHTDAILSIGWNYDGSKIVTSSKDKIFRVINPRTGEIINSGVGHQGGRPSRAIFLRDGRIFSTGFSKMAERQYAVWDEKNLGTPLTMVELDSSNGVLFPMYDEDTNVIYLCGKGDSNVRFFEYTPDEAPYVHFLNLYASPDPQRGFGFMPKRGLNIAACETARFYKLLNNGLCEAISFIVPRKGDLFQEDVYPDTASGQYAITAEEWFAGEDAGPKLIPVIDLLNNGKAKPSDPPAPSPPLPKPKPPQDPRPTPTPRKDSDPKVEPHPGTGQKHVEPPKMSQNGLGSSAGTKDSSSEISSQLKEILRRMDDFDARLKALEEKVSSSTRQTSSDDQMQF